MFRDMRKHIRMPLAAVTAGIGLVSAAALLSDRVPVWLGIARNRFDAPSWFPWTLDDTAFHVLMWFGLTLLATLAVRTVAARLAVGIAAILGGLVLEYLQIRLTATRNFEMSDVIANSGGAYLGLAVGLVLGAVIDYLEERRRERRAESGPHR